MNLSPVALRSKLINILILPYYCIRNTYPIWFGILNKVAREKFNAEQKTFNDEELRVIRELETNGIATTTLEKLFGDVTLLPTLRTRADALRTHAERNTKKNFLEQLFVTFPLLDVQNPFIKLALQEKVFNVINGYMKLWCKFEYMNLNVTMPVTPGTPAVQSQRWHRDPGDKKIIKMFVYLNDVEESAGPFIYVRGSQYGGKWRGIFRQRLPHGYYPRDGAVDARIPMSDIQINTAPAGTVIFADTTGLHKGGYATAKERIMFTAGYTTCASPRGIYYTHPENMDELLAQLPPKVAYAVTGKKFGEGGGY